MEDDFDKMYCGAIKRGDVLWCEIEKGKEGLVVALQDDVLDQSLPTVVCALIKPVEKNEEVLVNEVFLNKSELGVKKDGICMLHRIFTINRLKIFSEKGELKPERMKKIYWALDITLGKYRDKLISQEERKIKYYIEI